MEDRLDFMAEESLVKSHYLPNHTPVHNRETSVKIVHIETEITTI